MVYEYTNVKKIFTRWFYFELNYFLTLNVSTFFFYQTIIRIMLIYDVVSSELNSILKGNEKKKTKQKQTLSIV